MKMWLMEYEVVNPFYHRVQRYRWRIHNSPYANSRAWGAWETLAPRHLQYAHGPYMAIPAPPPSLPVIRPEDLIRLGIA